MIVTADNLHTKPDLDDDILEHYGVKGMKWGVRRSDAELARARSKRQQRDDKISEARGKTLAKIDKSNARYKKERSAAKDNKRAVRRAGKSDVAKARAEVAKAKKALSETKYDARVANAKASNGLRAVKSQRNSRNYNITSSATAQTARKTKSGEMAVLALLSPATIVGSFVAPMAAPALIVGTTGGFAGATNRNTRRSESYRREMGS